VLEGRCFVAEVSFKPLIRLESIFAIRQDPQIGVLSSTAAPENGLHPPLCIRIQVPHHSECLAAALRCLDAPDENLKLMPFDPPEYALL
jgi:hypothetical protein